jgi:hypothetical protein
MAAHRQRCRGDTIRNSAAAGEGVATTPFPNLPPTVAAIWPDVAARLPAPWHRAPQAAAPAGAAGRPTARVWKLSFPGAPPLALKLAAPAAPLEMEAQVLAWLGQRGCRVPAVLARSSTAPPAWLALEWCGDRTLDDVLQAASAAKRTALGRRLAAAVAGVEAALAPLGRRWLSDARGWRDRGQALRRQMEAWLSTAPQALAWLLGCPLSPPIEGALTAALDLAIRAEPSLGSLDYHARNVVVDGPQLTLVDFAAVGADWPERRFVQYGTATGASSPAGTFASVISPASVRAFSAEVASHCAADPDEVQARIDAHEILLLVTAAQHLQAVEAGEAHVERAGAWRNVAERRAGLLALLRRRLAPTGPAATLRSLVRSSAGAHPEAPHARLFE